MEPEERLETCLQQDATFDSISLIFLPNSQTPISLYQNSNEQGCSRSIVYEISYETIYGKL